MNDSPNYPYLCGQLESFLIDLPCNKTYNELPTTKKIEYISKNIKRMEEKAKEFNKSNFNIPL